MTSNVKQVRKRTGESLLKYPVRKVNVTIDFEKEKMTMAFAKRPPTEVTRQMHAHNFTYSRKEECWQGWLSKPGIGRLGSVLQDLLTMYKKKV